METSTPNVQVEIKEGINIKSLSINLILITIDISFIIFEKKIEISWNLNSVCEISIVFIINKVVNLHNV